jgi:hypothetical protein
MTVRVYVPTTLTALAAFLGDGGIGGGGGGGGGGGVFYYHKIKKNLIF